MKDLVGIIILFFIAGYVLSRIEQGIEPILNSLGYLVALIMTVASLVLVSLGALNIMGKNNKNEPGLFSIISGALIAYFFIFHFWPRNWPFR